MITGPNAVPTVGYHHPSKSRLARACLRRLVLSVRQNLPRHGLRRRPLHLRAQLIKESERPFGSTEPVGMEHTQLPPMPSPYPTMGGGAPPGSWNTPVGQLGSPAALAAPAAPYGGERDPYLTGSLGSSMDPTRVRIAKETYWNIRREAQSVRMWMTNMYKGNKSGGQFEDLYLIAENVDIELDRAHQLGGVMAVQ